MSEREIIRWVTVQGKHFPIYADENGNEVFGAGIIADKTPSVVKTSLYHGTDTPDIREFNIEGRESNGAIFFADDKDYAEEEAYVKNEKSGKGKYLYEVNLDIQNPMRVKMPQKEFGDPVKERKYIEQAKAQGNDSVIFTNDTQDEWLKQTFYAVFDPARISIKSSHRLR